MVSLDIITKDVDHGKTTLTEKLTGKWTDTHSEELKRGITIRLGYANFSIYKTKDGYTTKKDKDAKLLRNISIVDAPGHETLMATMLSGAAIMDGALLLIAANEECPQPQTKEHLMALQIIGINQIVIVQNKIDLVSKEEALKNYKKIKDFVKGTIAENAPIIPVSAQHGINIDLLLEAIEEYIKTPERNMNDNPLFFIARSFDVNKPGALEIKNMVGGILGGAVKQGTFKIGDKIEMNPGLNVNSKYVTIRSEIIGLMSGNEKIKEACPGGSIAILTNLDPSIVKSDSLTGNVVSLEGKSPKIFYDIKLEPKLLERVVGSKEDLNVEPIKRNESLVLNVNAAVTIGEVIDISKKGIIVRLKIPVCADDNDRVAISRRVGTRWRLIGVGSIKQ